MQEDINKVLAEIVGRYARRSNGQLNLTPESRLDDGIGIDSPRMVDIMLDIEDRLGITIDDGKFRSIKTFGQLNELIQRSAVGTQA